MLCVLAARCRMSRVSKRQRRRQGLQIEKYKPEQIVTLLWQIELEIAKRKPTLTYPWRLRSRCELLCLCDIA